MEENSKELRLRAEEEAEEAVTAAFLDAPTQRRRRQRLGRSSLESSTLGFSDSKEANSSNSSSKGSSDGSDSGDDEGKEEEEEEDDDNDEEEMEYVASNYPQENSGDDTNAYAPRSP